MCNNVISEIVLLQLLTLIGKVIAAFTKGLLDNKGYVSAPRPLKGQSVETPCHQNNKELPASPA